MIRHLQAAVLSPENSRTWRNISWLGIANAVVKPVWLLFLTALCPRILGVEQYGLLTAALALAMICISFADLGMSQFSLMGVARQRKLAPRYFSNFLFFRSSLLVLALAAAAATAIGLGYEGIALLSVLFAGLFAGTLNLLEYSRVFFRAFENLKTEAVFSVVEKILVVAAGATLLVLTRAVHWTLAGMAGGMALVALIQTAWIHRHLAPLKRRLVSPRFIRGSLPAMLPLGAAGLLAALYLRIDAVMIQAMLGDSAAGQYGQAYRILEALYMLPAIVVHGAIFPRFASLFYQKDHRAFTQLLRGALFLLLVASAGIALILAIFAPQLIQLLVDDARFAAAAPALRILCWTFPLFCVSSLLYTALVSMMQQRFVITILAAAVVLNVIGNLFALPMYGIMGAAAATLLTEAFIAASYALRYRVMPVPAGNRSLTTAPVPTSTT